VWQKFLDGIASLKKEGAETEDESDLTKILTGDHEKLKKQFEKEELKALMAGPYDKADAVVSFYAGAGGRDAQDWASMLFRMYQRWANTEGFKIVVLHEHLSEEGGIKTATLEIKGKYAYGYLKKESGVHRLVRISPFSPQKLRHTSFVLVEVLPVLTLKSADELKINSEDLETETFRSSGPGGQHVNKRETAVRVIHKPTGIAVAVQSGRSQLANKEKAIQILKAKLTQKLEVQQAKEISDLRTEASPEWGSQIRSYVLHPYKMVKDHRTNAETSDVEAVLGGDIQLFIDAEQGLDEA